MSREAWTATGLMVLPVVLLLGGVSRFLWEDALVNRQEHLPIATFTRPRRLKLRAQRLPVQTSPPSIAPSATPVALGVSAETTVDGRGRDDEERLQHLLISSYAFGLQRSRRLQNIAVLIGVLGTTLVYSGVCITLGLIPVRFEPPRSVAAGTLSAVAGLSIGLVTRTFLRESRMAQADLAEQRVQLQAHVREVRRERVALQTLRELTSGDVQSVAAAGLSEHLVFDVLRQDNAMTPQRRSQGRTGRARFKREKRRSAAKTQAQPSTEAAEHKSEIELDLSKAEARDGLD